MEDGDVKMAGIEEGDENSETPEIMGCPICNWKSKVNLAQGTKQRKMAHENDHFIPISGCTRGTWVTDVNFEKMTI